MIRCHASTLSSNYYTFFYGRKLLSAPKTDGVTHDNDCNIFKFSYFLDSMWSRLFRFFSFVDRVSSHYFCRHPPSQQEVGKLQERKQFLEKNLPIADPPFPSSLQMVTKFVAGFAILTNYKYPQGKKDTYIIHYNFHGQ